MNRDEILKKALDLINGDRANVYGDAYHNHGDICEGWNIIIREAIKEPGYVTPAHPALMMDWVKTCRLLKTITHEDSWVDKAGYTALGAEFVSRDRAPSEEIIARIKREQDENDENAIPTFSSKNGMGSAK